MREQLTFDDYENMFNGVLVRGAKGYAFVPEHNVGAEGKLERIKQVVLNKDIKQAEPVKSAEPVKIITKK